MLNQEQKSMKIPLVIYTDTESLQEKIHTCDNVSIVPTKPFKSKINKHTGCNYSLFTHWSFNNNKGKMVCAEVKTL